MGLRKKLQNHLDNVINKSWNFAGRIINEEGHEQNAVIGLAAEAGEVLDVCKKMWFHTEKPWSFYREKLVYELGDVLYYLLKTMDVFAIEWDELIDKNREKLESRHPELGKVTERFGKDAIK